MLSFKCCDCKLNYVLLIYSVLCSVLGFFVLLATLYDYLMCEDQSKHQIGVKIISYNSFRGFLQKNCLAWPRSSRLGSTRGVCFASQWTTRTQTWSTVCTACVACRSSGLSTDTNTLWHWNLQISIEWKCMRYVCEWFEKESLPLCKYLSFVLQWGATPFRMFIQQCLYAVDTFFFLSGMLVVSSQFRSMEQ